MMPDEHIEEGTVVQLNPATVRDHAYAGCFLVVTKARQWGVCGYVQSIGTAKHLPGYQAIYRANWDEFEPVGHAHWIAGQEENHDNHDDAPGLPAD